MGDKKFIAVVLLLAIIIVGLYLLFGDVEQYKRPKPLDTDTHEKPQVDPGKQESSLPGETLPEKDGISLELEPEPAPQKAQTVNFYGDRYYRRIEENVTDEPLKKELSQVVQLTEEGEFQQAYQALQQLPAESDFVKSFKLDFSTPLLFAEGDYQSALESVIQKREFLSMADEQYIRDMAYIIYHHRREKGQQAAEESLKMLQQQYEDKELSYVWMAIHPKALERLLASNLYPYQNLHDKQLAILRDVVKKHPNDPYIDYAYYFLHQYEKIITDFPQSPILDRAYYSHAYLPYYQKDLRKYEVRSYRGDVYLPYYHMQLDGQPPALRTELLEIAERFTNLVRKFPANKLTLEAYPKLANCYLNLPDAHESFRKFSELYTLTVELLNADVEKDLVDEYLSIIDRNSYTFPAKHGAEAGEELYKFLQTLPSATIDLHELEHKIAIQYFAERNYRKSVEFYDKLPEDWELSPRAITRKIALKQIMDLKEQPDSKAYLFKMGLILKNAGQDAEHAIPFFDQYLEKYADEEEIPKILMLKAACYRNARNAPAMLELYQRVVQEYPDSEFADDALAETGTYYLLWSRTAEPLRARPIEEPDEPLITQPIEEESAEPLIAQPIEEESNELPIPLLIAEPVEDLSPPLETNPHEKARNVLYQVIEKYPDGNAADNSYNWIAWSYLQDCQCRKAREVYQQILQKFPISRFRDYATDNIQKIDAFFANPHQVGENVLINYSSQYKRTKTEKDTWRPATVIEVGDNCCYKVAVSEWEWENEWVRLDQIKPGPDSEE